MEQVNILGVIPARYGSTRFPGKPLANIAGKPMIQRVYEQAARAELLSRVVVATDDERIFQAVESFGGNVKMTAGHHQNGTSRCREVMDMFPETDVVINIQGDEPFIHPEQIDLLAEAYMAGYEGIATLIRRETDPELFQDSGAIKVVCDNVGRALYFSRSPIPFFREPNPDRFSFLQHIGIYAFHAKILTEITRLPPSKLELAESLEQLRWMENGFAIRTIQTPHKSHSIDRPEDIDRVLKILDEE